MSRGFAVNWDRVAAMSKGWSNEFETGREFGREDREGEVKYLRAEIERLQKEVKLLEASRQQIIEVDEERVAEIERLKATHAKFAFEAGERFGEALSAIQELRGEIERLTAENRHLFNVVKDDALLVERYNAFLARRAQEMVERPRISSTE